ncbi:hypothetical protein BESB_066590 [Besnoitia besnoiti]|uniref:FCP1 homology domain-containing protein n=1 Tax=Besnoitia besnoiti TaxID=94643 RepID=A0A2A9MF91_BESBE|nr:hypothetical protein BESB_066590 [Besnoitia besnoiti]PFH34626.1 hypothetical protein BESB_066590 [Besnoitia besnoiti]
MGWTESCSRDKSLEEENGNMANVMLDFTDPEGEEEEFEEVTFEDEMVESLKSLSDVFSAQRLNRYVQGDLGTLPPAPTDGRLTVFLDIDETLVHVTPYPLPFLKPDSTFLLQEPSLSSPSQGPPSPSLSPVYLPGVSPGPAPRAALLHVYYRPFLFSFLERLVKTQHYELVPFTAALAEYADPILDGIEAKLGGARGSLFAGRLYRQHCARASRPRLAQDALPDIAEKAGRPTESDAPAPQPAENTETSDAADRSDGGETDRDKLADEGDSGDRHRRRKNQKGAKRKKDEKKKAGGKKKPRGSEDPADSSEKKEEGESSREASQEAEPAEGAEKADDERDSGSSLNGIKQEAEAGSEEGCGVDGARGAEAEEELLYVKDLAHAAPDRSLSRSVLLDNSAISFAPQLANGLLLRPFYGDPQDRELEAVLSLLLDLAGKHGDIRDNMKEAGMLHKVSQMLVLLPELRDSALVEALQTQLDQGRPDLRAQPVEPRDEKGGESRGEQREPEGNSDRRDESRGRRDPEGGADAEEGAPGKETEGKEQAAASDGEPGEKEEENERCASEGEVGGDNQGARRGGEIDGGVCEERQKSSGACEDSRKASCEANTENDRGDEGLAGGASVKGTSEDGCGNSDQENDVAAREHDLFPECAGSQAPQEASASACCPTPGSCESPASYEASAPCDASSLCEASPSREGSAPCDASSLCEASPSREGSAPCDASSLCEASPSREGSAPCDASSLCEASPSREGSAPCDASSLCEASPSREGSAPCDASSLCEASPSREGSTPCDASSLCEASPSREGSAPYDASSLCEASPSREGSAPCEASAPSEVSSSGQEPLVLAGLGAYESLPSLPAKQAGEESCRSTEPPSTHVAAESPASLSSPSSALSPPAPSFLPEDARNPPTSAACSPSADAERKDAVPPSSSALFLCSTSAAEPVPSLPLHKQFHSLECARQLLAAEAEAGAMGQKPKRRCICGSEKASEDIVGLLRSLILSSSLNPQSEATKKLLDAVHSASLQAHLSLLAASPNPSRDREGRAKRRGEAPPSGGDGDTEEADTESGREDAQRVTTRRREEKRRKRRARRRRSRGEGGEEAQRRDESSGDERQSEREGDFRSSWKSPSPGDPEPCLSRGSSRAEEWAGRLTSAAPSYESLQIWPSADPERSPSVPRSSGRAEPSEQGVLSGRPLEENTRRFRRVEGAPPECLTPSRQAESPSAASLVLTLHPTQTSSLPSAAAPSAVPPDAFAALRRPPPPPPDTGEARESLRISSFVCPSPSLSVSRASPPGCSLPPPPPSPFPSSPLPSPERLRESRQQTFHLQEPARSTTPPPRQQHGERSGAAASQRGEEARAREPSRGAARARSEQGYPSPFAPPALAGGHGSGDERERAGAEEESGRSATEARPTDRRRREEERRSEVRGATQPAEQAPQTRETLAQAAEAALISAIPSMGQKAPSSSSPVTPSPLAAAFCASSLRRRTCAGRLPESHERGVAPMHSSGSPLRSRPSPPPSPLSSPSSLLPPSSPLPSFAAEPDSSSRPAAFLSSSGVALLPGAAASSSSSPALPRLAAADGGRAQRQESRDVEAAASVTRERSRDLHTAGVTKTPDAERAGQEEAKEAAPPGRSASEEPGRPLSPRGKAEQLSAPARIEQGTAAAVLASSQLSRASVPASMSLAPASQLGLAEAAGKKETAGGAPRPQASMWLGATTKTSRGLELVRSPPALAPVGVSSGARPHSSSPVVAASAGAFASAPKACPPLSASSRPAVSFEPAAPPPAAEARASAPQDWCASFAAAFGCHAAPTVESEPSSRQQTRDLPASVVSPASLSRATATHPQHPALSYYPVPTNVDLGTSRPLLSPRPAASPSLASSLQANPSSRQSSSPPLGSWLASRSLPTSASPAVAQHPTLASHLLGGSPLTAVAVSAAAEVARSHGLVGTEGRREVLLWNNEAEEGGSRDVGARRPASDVAGADEEDMKTREVDIYFAATSCGGGVARRGSAAACEGAEDAERRGEAAPEKRESGEGEKEEGDASTLRFASCRSSPPLSSFVSLHDGEGAFPFSHIATRKGSPVPSASPPASLAVSSPPLTSPASSLPPSASPARSPAAAVVQPAVVSGQDGATRREYASPLSAADVRRLAYASSTSPPVVALLSPSSASSASPSSASSASPSSASSASPSSVSRVASGVMPASFAYPSSSLPPSPIAYQSPHAAAAGGVYTLPLPQGSQQAASAAARIRSASARPAAAWTPSAAASVSPASPAWQANAWLPLVSVPAPGALAGVSKRSSPSLSPSPRGRPMQRFAVSAGPQRLPSNVPRVVSGGGQTIFLGTQAADARSRAPAAPAPLSPPSTILSFSLPASQPPANSFSPRGPTSSSSSAVAAAFQGSAFVAPPSPRLLATTSSSFAPTSSSFSPLPSSSCSPPLGSLAPSFPLAPPSAGPAAAAVFPGSGPSHHVQAQKARTGAESRGRSSGESAAQGTPRSGFCRQLTPRGSHVWISTAGGEAQRRAASLLSKPVSLKPH